MDKSLLVSLALVSVLVAPVEAQDEGARRGLARCAAVAGDLERLVCFDELAISLNLEGPQPTDPTASAPEGGGAWVVSDQTNPIDDTRTVALGVYATQAADIYGNRVVLTLRCQSRRINVYISWQDYLGSDGIQVTTRLGTADAERKRWSISTDNTATFYPGNDGDFVTALMAVDQFIAQVTPYNESPVTAIFDVRGLARVAGPLFEACQ